MKTVETDTRVAFVDDEGNQIGQITFQQLGEDTLVLDHTGVNPDYRGQGIAQKLMALAVDKARREGKKLFQNVLLPFESLNVCQNMPMC